MLSDILPTGFECGVLKGCVKSGDTIAIVLASRHGQPAVLHIEKLWDRDITLTTRLVDTAATPLLMKAVASGRLTPGSLVTHRFEMAKILEAHDTFANAATHNALKVVLKAAPSTCFRRCTPFGHADFLLT